MLALARAVHDAAHDGDVEPLDAGIARLPFRHRGMDEPLNLAGELLERGGRRPPTDRPGGDQRHENAEPHGLEQFLRDPDLERAVATWLRGERDANGVA